MSDEMGNKDVSAEEGEKFGPSEDDATAEDLVRNDDAPDEKDDKVMHEVNNSSTESSKKITVTNFVLEPQGDDYYIGHKTTTSGVNLPVALIQCTEVQLQEFETMFSLGLDHLNTVTISDITNISINDACSNFLITEPVRTVHHYYCLQLEKFKRESNANMDDVEGVLPEWWTFIRDQFRKIFRGLIDGILFLLSRGCTCKYDLFVTPNHVGKVLPSMGNGSSLEVVIGELVKEMKSIVNLTSLGHNLQQSWLPSDLRHFFKFATKEKLKCVPIWWVLDHHFFWTSQELVDFTKNLRSIYKTEIPGFTQYISTELSNGFSKDWTHYIPDGVFKEIWRNGDPEMQKSGDGDDNEVDLKARGWFRVTVYRKPVDIVRYMVAVYSHHNGSFYEEFRSQCLEDAEIQPQLREMFPKIYEYMVNAIYTSAERNPLKISTFKALCRRK